MNRNITRLPCFDVTNQFKFRQLVILQWNFQSFPRLVTLRKWLIIGRTRSSRPFTRSNLRLSLTTRFNRCGKQCSQFKPSAAAVLFMTEAPSVTSNLTFWWSPLYSERICLIALAWPFVSLTDRTDLPISNGHRVVHECEWASGDHITRALAASLSLSIGDSAYEEDRFSTTIWFIRDTSSATHYIIPMKTKKALSNSSIIHLTFNHLHLPFAQQISLLKAQRPWHLCAF